MLSTPTPNFNLEIGGSRIQFSLPRAPVRRIFATTKTHAMTAVSVKEIMCRRPTQDSALTRVDLLAVIVIFALLSITILPTLARVTGKTVIAQCAANLEQYDLAMQIYGNEYQDKLPLFGGLYGGEWPWDTASPVVSFVTNTGVKWNDLYCPGTASRFTEQDNLRLFNYASGSFSVLGYATTIPGTAGLGPYDTNMNNSLTAQRVHSAISSQWLPINPATRVLVADATLTASGDSSIYSVMRTYNWVATYGGYVNAYGMALPHLSPHLSGAIPLGGNVGMLDGHVEWRSFTNMLPRTTISPCFYW
jgi:prepilin-type processing-associated H-X9-DG protein